MEDRIVKANQESVFDKKTRTLFVAAETYFEDIWDDLEDEVLPDEELPVWYRYGYKAETIILAEGIRRIGECAFCRCAVRELVLPQSLEVIEACAFENCKHLSEIVLPDKLVAIGANAFAGCDSLEAVVIPASVKELSENAFEGCDSLETVVFEGTEIKELSSFAFAGCSALREVTLPAKLETIGDGAFAGSGLKRIRFPETLKKIGGCAFTGCALEEIMFPASLTLKELGEEAFVDCPSLKSAVFADGSGQRTF